MAPLENILILKEKLTIFLNFSQKLKTRSTFKLTGPKLPDLKGRKKYYKKTADKYT